MCGRYMITSPAEAIRELFGLADTPEIAPRYNVAPTQTVPVVRRQAEGGGRELVPLRWGLIPHWAKDETIGNKLINARAESVASKPSFRDSFRKRRCLVVADGFYEWKKTGGRKQPYLIRLKGGGPFGFAGLWSRWRNADDEPVETFTIITTEANDFCADIHDRMPVIVPPHAQDAWLDPERPDAETLLRPYDPDAMEAWAVDMRVGNPRHDDPALIRPRDAQGTLL
ncbi:MAG: hypothetical protein GVY13_18875 [Alphaproteobacteria bacterium]|nr:hypothetical protein [Alphaproteobacteria bacterium]